MLRPFFNVLSDEYLQDAIGLVAEELSVLLTLDHDVATIQTLRSTALNKRQLRER